MNAYIHARPSYSRPLLQTTVFPSPALGQMKLHLGRVVVVRNALPDTLAQALRRDIVASRKAFKLVKPPDSKGMRMPPAKVWQKPDAATCKALQDHFEARAAGAVRRGPLREASAEGPSKSTQHMGQGRARARSYI